MSMINIPTAAGCVDSARLGRTLVHEHIFVMNEELRLNFPGRWDEEERIADAVAKLNELKAIGIDTIMDPTVIGLGRYIPRIVAVAAQTELNVVVATGLYTYRDLPFQFEFVGPGLLFDVPEPLTELFVNDITEGISGTGVRAAFLKCAIDLHGLTPGVERAMRAVGQASVQTGAPITVHTNAFTRSGLTAQRVLREEGVDLTRVIIGHCGDTADIEYLTQIAEAGSLLGMDRFGADMLASFEKRVDTVVELIRRGLREQIVLSHDASCFGDWFPDDIQDLAPSWNFTHISTAVIPALLDRGLSMDDINVILVDNPRRYLEAKRPHGVRP
jgi:phosphotriesterase-related protein